MLSQHKVQLSEYEAQYYEAGSGPVLIFLHGFLGSGTNWDLIAEQLKDQFRCIALDLLGFGGSSKPDLKYDIWHQVRFIDEFIQVLGLSEYSILGHSFGGWSAAAVAITHKSQSLQNIVLIAPAGIRDDEFVGRYKHLRPLLWQTPLVDWAIASAQPFAKLLGQSTMFQTIRRTRQTFLDQPVALSFLRDRLRPEDAIDTVEQDLDKIKVPTLIFAGAQDTTIPLWHCQAYADGIQDATLHIYEDGNHDLIQTHANQIADTIRKKFHV